MRGILYFTRSLAFVLSKMGLYNLLYDSATQIAVKRGKKVVRGTTPDNG